MRSMNRHNKKKPLKLIGLIILFSVILIGVTVFAINLAQGNGESPDENGETDTTEETQTEEPEGTEDSETPETDDENEDIAEDSFTDIRISAVGDVMGHMSQITSAYDSETDTHDFTSVFEDVEPYISGSDLAIANLETTLAGSRLPYSGYPMFNTPDSIVDALDFAGFDTIVTTNNHSLDTGFDGVVRTVEVIEEKGLDAVGTYTSEPESRVLIKDVQGIKVAILAYTEHLNGVDAGFSPEQVNAQINVISEERIISDINEAKESEADLIVSFMHWGAEYMREPNELQTNYAELLTREGVDIIFGSHPHVIQGAEFLEVDGNESIVAYSLGNFISNQRTETLGEERAPTEDGVIFNVDVQKNEQTGETTIQGVDYTPTWVYRNRYDGDSEYTYRILPVESALESGEFSESDQNRLRRSLDETNARLNIEESDEE